MDLDILVAYLLLASSILTVLGIYVGFRIQEKEEQK